jgi:hypothetical protein
MEKEEVRKEVIKRKERRRKINVRGKEERRGKEKVEEK